MRFAIFGAALFAAVNALPQSIPDTSSVTDLADTSSLVPDTSDLGVRQVPDTSDVTGLVDTSSLPVPDTGSIVPRQQHPAGPGRAALIALLGQSTYNAISKAVHTVGISAAHTEQEINQLVTTLNPDLGNALHQLLKVVDTLEADLVSIGFNT